MQINLTPPTDEQCDAIVSMLQEGAIDYWDCVEWDPDASDSAGDTSGGSSATLAYNDPDTGERKTAVVDSELVRKGVGVALSRQFNLNSQDKGRLFATICDEGLDMVDQDGADWIIQAALFGRLAFG